MLKKILTLLVAMLLLSSIAIAKHIVVALVTDKSGIGDKSFNEGIYNGLKDAQAKHPKDIEIKVYENKKDGGYETALEGFAEDKVDLVIGASFLMHDAMKTVASNYPKTNFILIDSSYTQDEYTKNLAGVVFNEKSGGYLAGVLAGSLTIKYSNNSIPGLNHDKKLGVIAGMSIAPVERYVNGFTEGVRQVCPECEVKASVLNTFVDQAKAKEIALAMYKDGVDIIFPVAGLAGLGVFEAAKEQNKFVIGADRDQNPIAPNNTISSVLKRTDIVAEKIVTDFLDGKFESGRTYQYDLQDDAVGLAPFHNFEGQIPANLKSLLDKTAQDIKSGKINTKVSIAK